MAPSWGGDSRASNVRHSASLSSAGGMCLTFVGGTAEVDEIQGY